MYIQFFIVILSILVMLTCAYILNVFSEYSFSAEIN